MNIRLIYITIISSVVAILISSGTAFHSYLKNVADFDVQYKAVGEQLAATRAYHAEVLRDIEAQIAAYESRF